MGHKELSALTLAVGKVIDELTGKCFAGSSLWLCVDREGNLHGCTTDVKKEKVANKLDEKEGRKKPWICICKLSSYAFEHGGYSPADWDRLIPKVAAKMEELGFYKRIGKPYSIPKELT